MADETRIETESGGAKGDKILRFDQIPAGPMMELAARYGLGSMKYKQKNGLDNWRNGYPFSLSMAALERHWYAFKAGEDNDDTIYAEAGLLGEGEHPLYDADGKLRPGVSHLAAVVWHCFFLMHHLVENPDLDDRPSTVHRRNAEKESNEQQLKELAAEEATTLHFDATTDGPLLVALWGGDPDHRIQMTGKMRPQGEGNAAEPQGQIRVTSPDWWAPNWVEGEKARQRDEDFAEARQQHNDTLNTWHNRPKSDDIMRAE